jgi:hypothetical protein
MLQEGYDYLFNFDGIDNDYGELHKNYETYNDLKPHITYRCSVIKPVWLKKFPFSMKKQDSYIIR